MTDKMENKNKIEGSQFADRGSSITNSKNQQDNSINKIRKESAIISFIVATISAIVASYVYDHWLK